MKNKPVTIVFEPAEFTTEVKEISFEEDGKKFQKCICLRFEDPQNPRRHIEIAIPEQLIKTFKISEDKMKDAQDMFADMLKKMKENEPPPFEEVTFPLTHNPDGTKIQ